MTKLDARIEQSLRTTLDGVAQRGELTSTERLAEIYAAFRDRFGPEALNSLSGGELLRVMHTHGNKESLVYWLEFKNDEEFPGQTLGSIAGGSAHKFGIFRRKNSSQWVKGSPQSEENISEAEAIAVASSHRKQLLEGVALLEALPLNADDGRYLKLQEELAKAAPDIWNLAWTHKYFSLLFPTKLDDFHNHHWQRFNLIKILQLPPQQQGLYVCAGRFISLANEFGWPINHFTTALTRRNGRPADYWRIGTRLGATESIWSAMRDGAYAAIGWHELGDLSPALVAGVDTKDVIRKQFDQHYPTDAKTVSRKAGEIRDFVERIKEGDLVVAADGQTVIGIGRVTGPYRYEPTEPIRAPHRRPVDWLSTSNWSMPAPEGLRTTLFPIGKQESNLIEIERRLLDATKSVEGVSKQSEVGHKYRLEGIPGRIQAILERKGQAILFGPPGTGKTYWARRAVLDLASLEAFRRPFSELSPEEKVTVEGSESKAGLVRSCTFHPAYGYEDFLEGFRPHVNEAGNLAFQLRDGIFKSICTDARKSDKKFYLVIDEINRGEIPRIFGELLTLLELDKRGISLTLPLSTEAFAVPRNVHVLGTMNTADRSIALLDTALRRRFGFVELMPDTRIFGTALVEGGIPLGPWLGALNDRIRAHLGRDARNLQIGHAYLLDGGKPVVEFSSFVHILAEDIIPLLEEYCYEDYSVLAQILGGGLVDESNQRIREELFAPSRQEELVQALLAPAPEIVTSTDAIAPQAMPEETEDSEPDSADK